MIRSLSTPKSKRRCPSRSRITDSLYCRRKRTRTLMYCRKKKGWRAPPRAERLASCSQSRGGNGGSCTCTVSAGRGQSYCTWCAPAGKCVLTHRLSACRLCGAHGSCAPAEGWGSKAWVGYWSPIEYTRVQKPRQVIRECCFWRASELHLVLELELDFLRAQGWDGDARGCSAVNSYQSSIQ